MCSLMLHIFCTDVYNNKYTSKIQENNALAQNIYFILIKNDNFTVHSNENINAVLQNKMFISLTIR